MKNKIVLLIFLQFLRSVTLSGYEDEAFVEVDEDGYAKSISCRGHCSENREREKRLADPPLKSRILDTMKSTQMLPLRPDEPDLLSFLRDKYELPKGKCSTKTCL